MAERHLQDASVQLHLSLIPGGKICLDWIGKPQPVLGAVAQNQLLSIPWCCPHKSDSSTKPGSLAVTEEQDGVQKENRVPGELMDQAPKQNPTCSALMLRLMQHKVTFRYRQNQVQDRLQSSEPYFHPHLQLGEE